MVTSEKKEGTAWKDKHPVLIDLPKNFIMYKVTIHVQVGENDQKQKETESVNKGVWLTHQWSVSQYFYMESDLSQHSSFWLSRH